MSDDPDLGEAATLQAAELETLARDAERAAERVEAALRQTGATMADALANDGEEAAERLEAVFRETGETIADTLATAARSGEMSFNDMVESILQDLARLALERLVIEPVTDWTDRLGAGLAQSIGDVIGQRASGGPVLAGAPYLVGEQGPEVFVPSSAGAVAPAGPTQIIHVTVNATAEPGRAVQHSERQISAAIARAAAAGGRML